MVRLLIKLRASAIRDRYRCGAVTRKKKLTHRVAVSHWCPSRRALLHLRADVNQCSGEWNSVRLIRIVGWLLLSISLSGCSRQPAQSDFSTARNALEGALECWKSGNAPTEWRAQSKIVVGDPDWEAGARLKHYVIDGECFDDGRNFHFKTVLEIVSSDGNVQKREEIYVVATHPVVTVFREQL